MFTKEQAEFLIKVLDQVQVNTTLGQARKQEVNIEPEVLDIVSKLEELTSSPEVVEAEPVN